jgi:phage portal protein BeeE
MGRFLDLFVKRAPERAPTEEPFSPVYVVAGQPVRYLSQGAIKTAEEAQKKSPQMYRITNFIASAVQSVPWFCEPDPDVGKSEQANPGDIKAINALLKSPNDTYTSQQMQYWIALNLMLYARAHFKVGVGSTNKPNGIYPLAAKHMAGVPNSRGVVESYDYGMGQQKTSYPTRRTAEKRGPGTAYAAEISFPTLSGMPEYNKAPAAIESLFIPINIITALMQRALDTASGYPNVRYVITAEKTLTRQQKETLTKHLEESAPGEEHSGEVLFLYNTDIKVHTLDNKLGDIHSKLPLDDMTRQIAGVFGVPVALLGLGSADAAKYASNYVESRLSFWQDTIVPSYLTPIAGGMTQALCPYGARVNFDLDAVAALWQGRADLGVKLSKVTFLTTTEKRAIVGFEKTDLIPEVIEAKPEVGRPVDDTGEHDDEDVAPQKKVIPIHGRA